MTIYTLRMVWPINEDVTWAALLAQACGDVPTLAQQAHAEVTGRVTFHVARSIDVQGSGRRSELVLIGEAPAVPDPERQARPYRMNLPERART